MSSFRTANWVITSSFLEGEKAMGGNASSWGVQERFGELCWKERANIDYAVGMNVVTWKSPSPTVLWGALGKRVGRR